MGFDAKRSSRLADAQPPQGVAIERRQVEPLAGSVEGDAVDPDAHRLALEVVAGMADGVAVDDDIAPLGLDAGIGLEPALRRAGGEVDDDQRRAAAVAAVPRALVGDVDFLPHMVDGEVVRLGEFGQHLGRDGDNAVELVGDRVPHD